MFLSREMLSRRLVAASFAGAEDNEEEDGAAAAVAALALGLAGSLDGKRD
jgi:hypothetical protein